MPASKPSGTGRLTSGLLGGLLSHGDSTFGGSPRQPTWRAGDAALRRHRERDAAQPCCSSFRGFCSSLWVPRAWQSVSSRGWSPLKAWRGHGVVSLPLHVASGPCHVATSAIRTGRWRRVAGLFTWQLSSARVGVPREQDQSCKDSRV